MDLKAIGTVVDVDFSMERILHLRYAGLCKTCSFFNGCTALRGLLRDERDALLDTLERLADAAEGLPPLGSE